MASDTDPHELVPSSSIRPAPEEEEPTRKTGATLKDIALAVDQIRVQFRDLARDVPDLSNKLNGLHRLVMEHADGWIALSTKVDQHESRIRRLECRSSGDCDRPEGCSKL